MAKKDNTELTVKGAEPEVLPADTFKALERDVKELAEVMQANAGNDGVTPYDLERVHVPAGGGLAWEIPTIKGAESVPHIEGIIIYKKDVRGYWPEAYSGEGVPPVCSSEDGMIGTGEPGGSCRTCPHAQYGSAPDRNKPGKFSKGQACKQARMLFVLQKDSFLPLLVTLPPGSLMNSKHYFLGLTKYGIKYSNAVVQISLERDKNETGITYSKAAFRFVRELTAEEQGKVSVIALAMRGMFEKATVIEGEVNG